MFKKKLGLLLTVYAVNSWAGGHQKISRNKYYVFYRHPLHTSPTIIKEQQNNKIKHFNEYRRSRVNASTCKELGAAMGVIGGFVAYGALITWIAMNNHASKYN